MNLRVVYVWSKIDTQCGNYRIFLSPRYYVKSIFDKFRCSTMAVLTVLEALYFDLFEFCTFTKAKIYQINNIQSL